MWSFYYQQGRVFSALWSVPWCRFFTSRVIKFIQLLNVHILHIKAILLNRSEAPNIIVVKVLRRKKLLRHPRIPTR